MAYTGFELETSPCVENAREVPISSITVAIGNLLELVPDATSWTLATSASKNWYLKGVASSSATIADTKVNVQLVVGQFWYAGCNADSNATQNFKVHILTDEDQVANTATDKSGDFNGMFLQWNTVGVAADKRLRGILIPGYGVDFNAAS